jgi:hypothetical protein
MGDTTMPTYETPEEIEKLVRELEADAANMLPGLTRQSVLLEVVRLRTCAAKKRQLASTAQRMSLLVWC